MRKLFILAVSFLLAAKLVSAQEATNSNSTTQEATSNSSTAQEATSNSSAAQELNPQIEYLRAYGLLRNSALAGRSKELERWAHRYDHKLKTFEESHKAIQSMLASMKDPDAVLIEPTKFNIKTFQYGTGVGLQLGIDKRRSVVVRKVFEASPAFNAGIRNGSKLLKINGIAVNHEQPYEVSSKLRGPLTSTVAVTFSSAKGMETVVLTRTDIKDSSVAVGELLPGNVAYIRLEKLKLASATSDMENALKKFGNANGLILDLRDNSGGGLSQVIKICNMFLAKGIIYSEIDADQFKAPTPATGPELFGKPIVILIDKGTANGAELLASSLRDNERGKLVGDTTFGGSSIKSAQRLPDGAGLSYTTSHWLTPKDVDIDGTGIEPDIKVHLSGKQIADGEGPWWGNNAQFDGKSNLQDKQLLKAIEVLKETLPVTTK